MADMPIIGDNNYSNFKSQGSRGYLGMFPTSTERAAAKSFADLGIPLIPENEWDDQIDAIERNNSSLEQIIRSAQLPHKDQASTNYCWVNAPTHCCEIIRLLETGKIISLSPASAGAPIKNFSNSGGWGSQALEFFKTNGLNESKDWPDNAIQRSFYTAENKEKAKKNIVLEYYKLNSFAERVSCVLAGIPTGDGYNWWRHEVTGIWLKKKSHDWIIRNSWKNWGDYGFGILTGSRKMADDSVAIVAMQAL